MYRLALFTTALLFGASAAAQEVLTLATTTSTDNSGLLAAIHPDFERSTGIRVKVIAKGTGASLQLGRDGNADVVLVHARAKEDEFIEAGFGTMRRDVMANDFVVVGPSADPAGARFATSASGALERIVAADHLFLSRGDGSGTHLKEQQIWRHAAVPTKTDTRSFVAGGRPTQFTSTRPAKGRYISIGQGMGKTIIMATERQAYTLVDRGTYYAFLLADPPRTDLAVVCEGDRMLANPYGVIAVNPKTHPNVNFAAAKKYIEWITSARVQGMIGRFRIDGKTLFHPAHESSH
ncbi:MAG: substrate-binding domain-containing protein [Planctomycetes bacterium]|nr:substrate-binding domain-containing protein [Planctomycetota bacterium]